MTLDAEHFEYMREALADAREWADGETVHVFGVLDRPLHGDESYCTDGDDWSLVVFHVGATICPLSGEMVCRACGRA